MSCSSGSEKVASNIAAFLFTINIEGNATPGRAGFAGCGTADSNLGAGRECGDRRMIGAGVFPYI